MIRIIAAVDTQRGLAKQGQIPWDLPSDRRYFATQTQRFGGRVLMGRKTFETIGHPLLGRQNFVLSRHPQIKNGVEWVRDFRQFIEQQTDDLWVIGGASVYIQVLPWAGELYLTQLAADFGCDLFFPDFNGSFELRHASQPSTENGITFGYNVYDRSPKQ
jgi:dihydrofolate reductase